MSKSARALQDVMTAVDAGNVNSASSDSSSSKLLGARQRSTNYGRGGGGARTTVAVVEAASSDASFEFSTAVNSYSSASPASMVFSDGQLRAHQFPAVRRSSGGSQLATPSPVSVRSSSSSIGSKNAKQQQQQAGVNGSSKRVSFATDGAARAAGGGQGKKSGGLLGCCGASARNEAVEPVARTDNRKVEAF